MEDQGCSMSPHATKLQTKVRTVTTRYSSVKCPRPFRHDCWSKSLTTDTLLHRHTINSCLDDSELREETFARKSLASDPGL